MFRRKKTEYISWGAYQKRVEFLDNLAWSQSVRKRFVEGV